MKPLQAVGSEHVDCGTCGKANVLSRFFVGTFSSAKVEHSSNASLCAKSSSLDYDRFLENDLAIDLRVRQGSRREQKGFLKYIRESGVALWTTLRTPFASSP